MAVSVFLLAATFLFYKLDARNRQLIKIGEVAIAPEFDQLAAILQNPGLRLIAKAEEKPKGIWSFRQITSLLFIVVTGLSASILLICIATLLHKASEEL